MAQGTRDAAATTAAPNGVAGAHSLAPGAVNRKKQKRREKQAAKLAAETQRQPATSSNGVPPPSQTAAEAYLHAIRQGVSQFASPELGEPHYEEEGDFYSDEDEAHYEEAYGTNGHYSAGYSSASAPAAAGKKASKKKRPVSGAHQPPYIAAPRHHPAPPPPSDFEAPRRSGQTKDRIWNTSTMEERERIREFWLSLGEDERKSLVKIEKEAVLRKMKEQQKHSCSCTVCGRKRTAIEEELEVLYDAYYEELEQYANQQDIGALLPPANYRHTSSAPHTRPMMTTHPPPGHYDEPDDLSQGDEDDEDQDYSQSEGSSGEDYSSEEPSLPPPEAADFLQFGSSLQVKGGILTVADDLLKNDGKKFIEMMEQLAERRMQREEEAQYAAHPSMYRSHSSHNHAPQPEEEDDYEDDEDNEGDYDNDDGEEEDDDEDDIMTEEQRMEEGRRMFQIFAARMFEQRVLQAYREKVAAERQQRLLEELAEEDDKKEAKEAKKAKEAQKRKEKKDKQKQAKAEVQARKEAEIAAKEAEVKAAEEKRLEEQRRKKDEQRKKKEADRKVQEEEKQRKETERLKRQQEERDRQQEAERKAREQKAQEKKTRDDAKRKDREEREAKESEAREKKAREDKDRKEREAKAKTEKERPRKEEHVAATQNATINKKVSQSVAVALPPQLLKQSSSSGFPSPHVTPVVPKAPTPNRPRQSSQQGSHGSSPKNSHAIPATSKSMSPNSQIHNPIMPKSILTKPPSLQQPNQILHSQPVPTMPPMGPPPGMQGPTGMGINMPPGLNGFPHGQGSMLPSMMGPRHNMPLFPPQPGPANFRPFPPPGMHAPSPMSIGRGFPMDGPPGFGPMPGFGAPNQIPGFGMGIPAHTRQTSGSFEKPNMESPVVAPQAQPIQRPAPIQRPSSVKPHEENRRHPGPDIDDLANHLGSKALLDDEEDIPEYQEVPRRTSLQQHPSLGASTLGFGFSDGLGQPRADSYAPFGGSSNAGSVWGTPPMPFPMTGAPGWGNSPTSGLFSNQFPILGAPRPNEPRIVWIRRMVCHACKVLAVRQPSADGYLEASEVQHHVDSTRVPTEPSIQSHEVKEACDIFGDPSNGGGSLEYKETGPNSGMLSHIKFVEAGGPPPTLGEIGSPVPGHSVPVGGFGGRPFPGLGPQGF
ncbi:salt tolerance down-regulator-domain-containing protein [Massariosphaeria phaeospora]|uniref:Stress response protein NST1 n=1 Tax=Massariosphaeria phaeospora TaxID=100035 RepID=A0A7C8I9Y3_9PLEO|nr:salt tolerance down-regulator-domain-containing protein [Massariosphaeria phaeospora]